MKIYVVPDPNENGFQRFKRSVDAKWRSVKSWVKQNEGVILTIAPAVIGGVFGITKYAIKKHNLAKEADLKNLYCYDRSLGHYWRLRRALSNSEWLEINNRMKMGEKLGDILEQLNVLK